MAELQEQADRNFGSNEKIQAEMRNARKRCDELSSEISRLNSQVNDSRAANNILPLLIVVIYIISTR